jgi:hypothetical protein
MVATYKTRDELIEAALGELQILAAGQAATSEDSEVIDGFIDPMVAQLAARETVYIGDISEIPLEWFQPLSVILADMAKIRFGLTGEGAATVRAAALQAEEALLFMQRGRPSYEPQPIDFGMGSSCSEDDSGYC